MIFHSFSVAARPPRRTRVRRGAFTFVEILFAVIVLGIGFIMLAGMFPIAIQQTQTTLQETTAAAVARNGINILTQIADGNLCDVNPANVAGQPGIVEDFYRRLPSTYAVYSGATNYAANVIVAYTDSNGTKLYESLQTPNTGNAPDAANSQYWINVPDKWATVKGSMINSSDNRFAWTALYRRDVGSPYAQIFVFVAQCRHQSQYIGTSTTGTANDLDWNGATAPPGPTLTNQIPTILMPKKVSVTLAYQPGGTNTASQITFLAAPSTAYIGPTATSNPIATGNFVVIANGTDQSGNAGSANSRVYRVGNSVNVAGGIWELQPGADLASSTEAITTAADAYILGCEYDNFNGLTTAPPPPYVGLAPDIGLYVSFVQVH